ncbi:senescence-induced receptor-like serine/threonine-protein kinase [Carex rostrata]
MVRRADLGGSTSLAVLRYPQDKYDRWWTKETLNGTIEISSNSTIEADPDETPAIVMQTAATTSSTQQPLNLYWNVDDKSSTYYWIFHFYEIQASPTGQREFDLLINGAMGSKKIIFQTWYRITLQRSGFINYNVSLVATSNSTLPPLLNGYELYKIAPVGVPTYSEDVAAINTIKKDHQIKKGWSGDPCLPKEFIWSGVSCTSNSSNISWIIGLNLSYSGLIGPLSYNFGNLTALVSLDLSGNDLSGSLPSSLDQLTALKYLDIRGNNKMSTNLPFGLQKRQKNGSLTYRFGDLPIPSPSPSPSSKKNIIITAVVVPLLFIAVVVATIYWLRQKRKFCFFANFFPFLD